MQVNLPAVTSVHKLHSMCRALEFIQSRGRARARQSNMVLMVQSSNTEELDLIAHCRKCAPLPSCYVLPAAEPERIWPPQTLGVQNPPIGWSQMCSGLALATVSALLAHLQHLR